MERRIETHPFTTKDFENSPFVLDEIKEQRAEDEYITDIIMNTQFASSNAFEFWQNEAEDLYQEYLQAK